MDVVYTLGKDGLKTAYTSLQEFALYLTLGLAVILAIAFAIVYFKAKDKLPKFKTFILGTVIGYAVTLSACVCFFMVARLILKEEIDVNFYLMLGFFALLLIYAISAVITKSASDKAFKICNIVGISLAVVYGIILLCVLPTVGEEYQPLSNAGMYIFTALLIILAATLTILFGKDKGTATPSKSLSFAGICIALSFALSFIKIFSMPQGGSVTLASMLPLIIYAYVFGARKGVLAGVIYGILQILQSPQIYQPVQVLIDYPVAFGLIGLAGIVKNTKLSPLVKFMTGACIAVVGRYVAHILSGYYVFSSWAMEGYTALSWALVYNLYLIAELGIILVVGALIFSSKAFVKELDKVNPLYEE